MATVQSNPLVLKDYVFSVGADEYTTFVSNVTFTPSYSKLVWHGGNPSASFTAMTNGDWDVSLTYIQDWETPNSLSLYLFNNRGNEVTVTFKPKAGSGPTVTATILVSPGAIGGAVNTYAETTVSLGVKGEPLIVAGTATIPTISASSPTSGPIAGGTLVKVTGTKFTGTTAVHFGTTPATQFTVESDSTIYAVAPAQAAGSKPVKVTNAVGQSTQTGAYTYV